MPQETLKKKVSPEFERKGVDYRVVNPNEEMGSVKAWGKTFRIPRRLSMNPSDNPAELIQSIIENVQGATGAGLQDSGASVEGMKPRSTQMPGGSAPQEEVAPGGNKTEEMPAQVGGFDDAGSRTAAELSTSGSLGVEDLQARGSMPGAMEPMKPNKALMSQPAPTPTAAAPRPKAPAPNFGEAAAAHGPRLQVAPPSAEPQPMTVPDVNVPVRSRSAQPVQNERIQNMIQAITSLEQNPDVRQSLAGGRSAGARGPAGTGIMAMDYNYAPPPQRPAAPAPQPALGAVNMASQGAMDFRPGAVAPLAPPPPPREAPQMRAQAYPYPGPAAPDPRYGLQAAPSAGPMDFAPPTQAPRAAAPPAAPPRPGQVNMASQGALDMRPGAINPRQVTTNPLREFGAMLAKLFSR